MKALICAEDSGNTEQMNWNAIRKNKKHSVR